MPLSRAHKCKKIISMPNILYFKKLIINRRLYGHKAPYITSQKGVFSFVIVSTIYKIISFGPLKKLYVAFQFFTSFWFTIYT